MSICDLGLGAGFNVLETLRAAAHNPHLEELELYSFDLHTQGIDLLVDSIALFPDLLAWRPALERLKAAIQSGNPACFGIRDICPNAASPAAVKWNILLGDAFELVAQLPNALTFDAIFYDMFSWQSAPQLWTRRAFEKFFCRLSSNGVLMTYSTATPVRAIILSLGGWVGDGAYVSPKMRSTIASKNPRRILEPLPREWLERFRRSGRQFFETEDTESRSIIFEGVVSHTQFTSSRA